MTDIEGSQPLPPGIKFKLDLILGPTVIGVVGLAILAPHALSWFPLLPVLAGFAILGRKAISFTNSNDATPMFFGALFLAWGYVTCLWSPTPAYAAMAVSGAALSLLLGYCCIVLARAFSPAPRIQHKGIIYTHWILLGILIIIFNKWVDLSSLRGWKTDVDLTSWAYNRATLLVVLFAPVVLEAYGALGISKTAKNLFVSLWVAASFITIFYSASEAAMLAAAIAALFFAAANYFRRLSIMIFFGLFIVGVIGAPFVMNFYFDDIKSSPLAAFKPGTILARLEIWHAVTARIMQFPIAGNGVEAMRFAQYTSAHYQQQGIEIVHPHSLVFQLWSDVGLIGVLLFAAFIWAIADYLAQGSRRLAIMQCTTLVAAIAIASVSHGIWQAWWFGMLMAVFMTNRAIIPGCEPEHVPIGSQTILRSLWQENMGITIPLASIVRVSVYAFAALVALYGAFAFRLGPTLANVHMQFTAPAMLASALVCGSLARYLPSPSYPLLSHHAMYRWLLYVVMTTVLFFNICALTAKLNYVPRTSYILFIWIMMTFIYLFDIFRVIVGSRFKAGAPEEQPSRAQAK